MTTTRRPRRTKPRPAKRRPVPESAYGPPVAPAGLSYGLPESVGPWPGRTITVQLPPALLSAGRLPSLAVDDVVEAAPVFWLDEYSPVYVGDDAWWNGEHGTVAARCSLVPPAPSPVAPETFLVDVADALFPLDWPRPEPFLTPRIDARGGLYLDPRFDPDGELASTGFCCRRPFRVTALRRYQRTAGTPHTPRRLVRLPDPWDVEEREAYVADLTELGDAG